ncbi:MAG: ABC transporter substrate-binding protein [Elusimicrobiota bacterium]
MNKQPLRYWFWYLPTTLDTYKSDRAGVMMVAKNIYAPLVSTFLDGKPQGMIAESWEIDSAGKIWHFKIRKGLRFDDGTPITADIVLKNFRRILWLTRKEGLLLNSLMPEISEWEKYDKPLSCIYVENDIIVFKFSKRPVNLFEEISMPIYGIANPKCFDEKGQWKDALCISSSGQYKIKEITTSKIVLESRHIFPKVQFAPDIVEIRARTDRNTIEEILKGNADLIIQPSFDLSDEVLNKVCYSELQITSEPTARMHFMQLNAYRPPFNNKTLRQSIRDVFLNLLQKDTTFLSETELNPSFIPKGGVGYISFKIPRNVKIKKVAEKEVVVLLSPVEEYPINKGQKIQKILEQKILQTLKMHGLKPKVIRCDGGELIERRRRGDFDVLFRFSGVSIDDPYAALRMMFMSNIGACIPDPSNTISRLIEQAESVDDPNIRKQIAEKINKTIYDEAAIITYTHSSLVYIHTNNVDLSHINLFSDPIEFRAVNFPPGDFKSGDKFY